MAFTRGFAFQKRNHNTLCAQHAGTKVGNGNANTNRALAWKACNGHKSTHTLGDLVKTGTFGIWAILAKARNAAKNNFRIDGI